MNEYEYIEYSALLDQYKIDYVKKDIWLTVGTPIFDNNWLLFITVRPLEAVSMLKEVLPVLQEAKVAFRILKEQKLHYQLNEGQIVEKKGEFEHVLDFAKCITIYTSSVDQAKTLVKRLKKITSKFNGPEIIDALKVGKTLYASYCQMVKKDNESDSKLGLVNLRKSKVPFKIQKKLSHIIGRKRIFGKYFIPIEILRQTPKGIVYKAINIRRLSLTWCLLKVGRSFAFEDHCDRDIRTRLLWEKKVLEELSLIVPAPKVIAHFDRKHFSCLVLEWMTGDELLEKVKILMNKTLWKDLDNSIKKEILSYYFQILDIIGKIHHNGYVHRDITPTNFIIMENNEIGILDFELSYSLKDSVPNPPFQLGTFGYISPEQKAAFIPTIYEDIYSLGALLLSIISDSDPEIFLKENENNLSEKIKELTGSHLLSDIVVLCLKNDPLDRPNSTESLKTMLLKYFNEMGQHNYQKSLLTNAIAV